MVLNHINQKMPIYKDCTMFEVVVVSTAYLLIVGLILSLITKILFGYGVIGTALTLLTMVYGIRFCLSRLQRIKYGKPYGYYQQLFLKKISNIHMLSHFWHSPWLIREGRWSVRRRS